MDAHKLTGQILKKITELTSANDRLATAIEKRGNIVLDTTQVTEQAVAQFHQVLREETTNAITRMRADFQQHEQNVNTERLRAVEKIYVEMDASTQKLNAASDKLDKAAQVTGWDQLARVLIALVPFFLLVTVLTGTVGLVASWCGVTKMTGWAWGIVLGEGDHPWYARLGTFVGIMATLSVVTGLTVWLGKKLRDVYREWEHTI